MSASQRRTVTVLVAALGVAFLLVWATSGPAQVIGARHPQTVAPHADKASSSQQDQDTADRTATAHDRPPTTDRLGSWVQDLTAFALLLAGLLLGGTLVRHLFIRIRRELADERLVVALDPPPDLAAARAALEEALPRQREALHGSHVRSGIVACWVIFEEAAAEAHVQRRPAETASAFVVRLLHTLDVDPRPVGELSHLFLEARFSSHPMGDDARERAERALAAIHEELARTGVAP